MARRVKSSVTLWGVGQKVNRSRYYIREVPGDLAMVSYGQTIKWVECWEFYSDKDTAIARVNYLNGYTKGDEP